MLIRVARSRRGVNLYRVSRDRRLKADRMREYLARKSTWRESYFLAAFQPMECAESGPSPGKEWWVVTRHEKNRGDH